jgi:hypothetical protein
VVRKWEVGGWERRISREELGEILLWNERWEVEERKRIER